MNRDGSLHKGHRERLLRNFHDGGRLTVVQSVEALLFYVFPREDTNETAHRLLNSFGSLEGLLTANEGELAEIKGMGSASARKLRLLLDLILFWRKARQMYSKGSQWSYHSVLAFLNETVAPKLLRNDVGCVAVILKDDITADTCSLASLDTHIIRFVSDGRSDGELCLICIPTQLNGKNDISDDLTCKLSSIGIDAIASISPFESIDIELIPPTRGRKKETE